MSGRKLLRACLSCATELGNDDALGMAYPVIQALVERALRMFEGEKFASKRALEELRSYWGKERDRYDFNRSGILKDGFLYDWNSRSSKVWKGAVIQLDGRYPYSDLYESSLSEELFPGDIVQVFMTSERTFDSFTSELREMLGETPLQLDEASDWYELIDDMVDDVEACISELDVDVTLRDSIVSDVVSYGIGGIQIDRMFFTSKVLLPLTGKKELNSDEQLVVDILDVISQEYACNFCVDDGVLVVGTGHPALMVDVWYIGKNGLEVSDDGDFSDHLYCSYWCTWILWAGLEWLCAQLGLV